MIYVYIFLALALAWTLYLVGACVGYRNGNRDALPSWWQAETNAGPWQHVRIAPCDGHGWHVIVDGRILMKTESVKLTRFVRMEAPE
jgi:hypothetical protein